MTEAVRCWLVERTFDDRNLVTVVYATPDGERYVQRERSYRSVRRSPTTAAVDVPETDLQSVEDPDVSERYREEAARTAERYGPDDEV